MRFDKRLVFEAWEKVRANKGAPGVDAVSVEAFEARAEGQPLQAVEQDVVGELLPGPGACVWRYRRIMGRGCGCSGCRTRLTGWPRRRRRCCWKTRLEPIFHPDSYGYRPGEVAHDALARDRKRCWDKDWVVDFDIRAFFDTVPHDLLLKAVAHHTDERWVLLYI